METILAITKYLGPTNTRGARIRVKAPGVNCVVPFDYAADNANRAAVALVLGVKYADVRYAGLDDHYLVTRATLKRASK